MTLFSRLPCGVAPDQQMRAVTEGSLDRITKKAIAEPSRRTRVNREHVAAVIREIENAKKFSMLRFWNNCGTPSCIAGHAAALAGWDPINDDDTARIAREYLGITARQGDALFYHVGASRKEALKTLRHLWNTGDVEWSPMQRFWAPLWRWATRRPRR